MALLDVFVQGWKWFPILVILIDAGCSFYVYIFQFCVVTLDSAAEKISRFTMFHVLFLPFIWTFWKTVFTRHVPIPDQYKLSHTQIECLTNLDGQQKQRILYDILRERECLNLYCYAPNGTIRYCKICGHLKPIGTHHCATCKKCITDSSHHCIFLNNCISASNYAYYIGFLGISLLLCIYVLVTTIPYSRDFWERSIGGPEMYFVLSLSILTGIFTVLLVMILSYIVYVTIYKFINRRLRQKSQALNNRPYGRYLVVRDGPTREFMTPL